MGWCVAAAGAFPESLIAPVRHPYATGAMRVVTYLGAALSGSFRHTSLASDVRLVFQGVTVAVTQRLQDPLPFLCVLGLLVNGEVKPPQP